MCGICGYVATRGKRPDTSVVKRMIRSLYHRGPDGSGLYYDNRAVLGHTRLSIIDLSGGAQPMTNEDETLWLSFNGEIFNYVELREELKSLGHIFRTASDSEVILHGWEQWGPAALNRFNGQWGFALWDTQAESLVLSVDPYGIRPVFYHEGTNGILFASEIKAIFQDASIPRRMDPAGLSAVYVTWGLVDEHTCFDKIHRVVPGHYVEFSSAGKRSVPYRAKSLSEPGEMKNLDPEELHRTLLDAVNLRFTRSDVPVGAYLSGGLDSSILVSLITRHTNINLETFSIRFDDKEYDEGSFQDALSRDLGTRHHAVRVGAGEMMEAFPDVIYHTEQPILRTAPIPMFLLSRLVRRNGYKVVVTGEGADEFFAGYDLFRETAVRQAILDGASDAQIVQMMSHLYPWMVRSPAEARGMGRSFFERNLVAGDPFLSHRTRWDNGKILLNMLNPEITTDSNPQEKILLPEKLSEWSPLFRAQWLEIRTLLNGYLLSAQGDRMLMANSIEGRFPFLDPAVTSFANRLADEQKLSPDLDEKAILKKTFKNDLPERISNRPKQPYRAPDAATLFSDPPSPWAEGLLSADYIEKTGLFRTPVVTGLFEKCRRMGGCGMSNRDNMMAVAAVSTLLLHDRFIASDVILEEAEADLVVDRRF